MDRPSKAISSLLRSAAEDEQVASKSGFPARCRRCQHPPKPKVDAFASWTVKLDRMATTAIHPVRRPGAASLHCDSDNRASVRTPCGGLRLRVSGPWSPSMAANMYSLRAHAVMAYAHPCFHVQGSLSRTLYADVDKPVEESRPAFRRRFRRLVAADRACRVPSRKYTTNLQLTAVLCTVQTGDSPLNP